MIERDCAEKGKTYARDGLVSSHQSNDYPIYVCTGTSGIISLLRRRVSDACGPPLGIARYSPRPAATFLTSHRLGRLQPQRPRVT